MSHRKLFSYPSPLPEDPEALADLALAGDRRAIPKIITIFGEETDRSRGATRIILRKLFPLAGNAHVIGITGPPGVGKSTVVAALIETYLDAYPDEKIACVLVDPTSQFTGGAILGDRLRIPPELSLNPRLYIRSLAARSRLGGLAPQIRESIVLLAAAGYRHIILETVGVGQSEIEIVRVADTVVLACQPGSGDSIQMLKSGILEIGHIIIVNKGDLGRIADEMIETVRRSFSGRMRDGWEIPIVKTSTVGGGDHKPFGIDDLFRNIARHHEYLTSSGQLEVSRRASREVWIRELVEQEALRTVRSRFPIDRATRAVVTRTGDESQSPYDVATEILREAGLATSECGSNAIEKPD